MNARAFMLLWALGLAAVIYGVSFLAGFIHPAATFVLILAGLPLMRLGLSVAVAHRLRAAARRGDIDRWQPVSPVGANDLNTAVRTMEGLGFRALTGEVNLAAGIDRPQVVMASPPASGCAVLVENGKLLVLQTSLTDGRVLETASLALPRLAANRIVQDRVRGGFAAVVRRHFEALDWLAMRGISPIAEEPMATRRRMTAEEGHVLAQHGLADLAWKFAVAPFGPSGRTAVWEQPALVGSAGIIAGG